MRPIRGPRHAADDERTVEAPPEEPTLSAGLDVRAAFEAQDKTVPGAVVGLVPLDAPIEEAEPKQGQTMPLVSPAVVRDLQTRSRVESEPRLAPVAAHVPLPPPSDPILVTRRDEDASADGDDGPIDIPGVGAAQRKRMLRIVIGVLSVCGLLCVGAVVRQLLGGSASSTSTSTSTPTPTPTSTPTSTSAATPSATAAPSVVASPEPSSAPSSAPSAAPVVASAAPEPVAVPTPIATPTPVSAPTPPAARPRPQDAPPPAPARRPAAPAQPHARPAAGGPAKPKPAIVRDAPF